MDFTQGIKIVVNTEGAASVSALGAEFDNLKAKASGAGAASKGAGDDFDIVERSLGRLQTRLIMVAAQWLLYKGIIDGLKGSDAMRDLEVSLGNVEGSTVRAAASMQFFKDAALQTRSSFVELGNVYEQLFRNNVTEKGKGGFTSDELKVFTVELANAAVAAKVSTEQMVKFWEAVKSGKTPRDKKIMDELGLTPADAKDLETVKNAIVDANNRAKDYGQTMESTLLHIRDAWISSFAPSKEEAQKAYAAILAEFTKPAILESIKNIGKAFIEAIPFIVKGVSAAIDAIKILIDSTVAGMALIAKTGSDLGAAIDTWLQNSLRANSSKFQGSPLDNWLSGAKARNEGASKTNGDIVGGALDANEASITSLKKTLGLLTDEVDKHTKSLEENAKNLQKNADARAKDEAAARKHTAALQEAVNINKNVQESIDRVNNALGTGVPETPLEKKLRELNFIAVEFATTATAQIQKMRIAIDNALKNGTDPTIIDAMRKAVVLLGGAVESLGGEHGKLAEAQNAHVAAAMTIELVKQKEQAIALANVYEKIASSSHLAFEKFGTNSSNPSVVSGILDSAAMTERMHQEVDIVKAGEDYKRASADERRAIELRTANQWATIIGDANKDAVKAAEAFKSQWTDKIGPLFNDLLTNGGKSFGQIASAMFLDGIKGGSDKLADVFGGAILSAFGAKPVNRGDYGADAAGTAQYQSALSTQKERQSQIFGAITAGIGAVSQFADIASGKLKESAAQIVMSFTAAGASIGSIFPGAGTIIGAVVGFVVGAVAAIIAPAVGKDYQYAKFGITNGQAFVDPNKNINAGQTADMLRALTDTMNGFVDGYIKILLKFPLDVIAGLALGVGQLNFTPGILSGTQGHHGLFGSILGSADPLNILGNGGISSFIANPHGSSRGDGSSGTAGPGGDPFAIGDAASAHFMEHFDAWVKNQLPAEIAETFRGQVGKSFEAMGMTTDKFGKVWDSLKGMDPKAALQVLSDMADALISFAKVSGGMQNLGSLKNLTGGGKINADGSARAFGVNDYMQNLLDGQDQLIKLGIAVKTLVGPDQVAAAKELGNAEKTLFDNLVAYLNKLSAMSSAFSRSIEDKLFQLQIDQAGLTPGAAGKNNQSALYENRYNQDVYQLKHAKELGLSAEDVDRLSKDASDLATKIYDLDPTKRAKWYTDTLLTLGNITTAAYEALGQQAKTAVEKELAALQPVLDWFKGLPGTVTPAVTSMVTEFNNAGVAVKNFRTMIESSSRPFSTNSATPSVSTSGAHTDVVVSLEVSDPANAVRNIRSRRVTRR